MELAVEVVKLDRKEENCRRRVGVRRIAQKLKIPAATLNNRVTGKVTGFKHKLGGMNQLFTDDQEKELVKHLVKHSDSGFPFTPREVRAIVKEFGVSLGLREDDLEKEVLSRNWFLKFIKRNYESLIEKTPQQLAQHRAKCTSRHVVRDFIDYLEAKYREKGIESAEQVWNIDETGLIDIPKMRKIVCARGKKVNQVVGKEKGETTTIVAMANAAGRKVPPLVIHKSQGVNIKESWKSNCHGALVRGSETGWINSELFAEMGYHFLGYLEENNLEHMPHLILLDGHSTHTHNDVFLDLMAEHGITVIQLLAHTSHVLQPLDNSPFAALKSVWSTELHWWNRKKAGQAITKEEWFLPFNRAWRNVTGPSLRHGFRVTGIWPANFDAIPDNAFKEADLLSGYRPPSPRVISSDSSDSESESNSDDDDPSPRTTSS